MSKIRAIAWFVYFNLLPFYFFSSGTPQLADYYMIFLSIMISIFYFRNRQTVDKEALNIFTNLLIFSSYAFISTCIWAIVEQNSSILLYPLYYFYDAWIFILMYMEFKKNKEKFLKIAFYSVGFSSLIIFLSSFSSIIPSLSIRETIFFNNPNQLGYFSLSTACILVTISEFTQIKKIPKNIFLLCLFWLALVSLSKAAIISILVLYLIHFFRKVYLIVGVSIILAIVLFNVGFNKQSGFKRGHTISNVELRLSNVGRGHDDNLDRRGYNRLINYPNYLLFGAAEGAARTRSYYNPTISDFGAEFHSTWGTLIFCYGIIGSFIFLMFLYRIFVGNKLIYLGYFFPIITYGFTHQGLRFTQFWILLAFIFVGKYKDG